MVKRARKTWRNGFDPKAPIAHDASLGANCVCDVCMDKRMADVNRWLNERDEEASK